MTSFFSEGGEPCGVFSKTHIIVAICCFLAAWIGAFFSRKLKGRTVLTVTRVLAVTVTVLEIIKIAYTFSNGQYNVNQWLPLWFCSLFIYALWMSGFGKGIVKKMGDLFIAGGAIVAGASFLIMPLTSVANYPMLHYLSCYSMFFHTMMHYLGLTYLASGYTVLTIKDFPLFASTIALFCILGAIINVFCNSNLMFMSDPYNIPVGLLHTIHDKAPFLYKLTVIFGYSCCTYLPTLGVYKLFTKNKNEKTAAEEKEAHAVEKF